MSRQTWNGWICVKNGCKSLRKEQVMEKAVEIKALSKTYRSNGLSTEALRGMDFQVAPGEFVAIMGPSGCGKSTLLHLLAGLDKPTSGEVLIAGQRMDTLSESGRAVLRRQTIGIVFQAYNLIPNLTVADNVDLPGLLVSRSRQEVTRKRNELLATLSIPDKANALPGELSGGQQQRVAIARALINHPIILLADEPTGNLDSHSAAEVLHLLRDFHARGQTILMVTHDATVGSYAGRVFFMRDGKLVDETRLAKPGDAGAVLSQLIKLEM
jgi:putative ABC transport system ATP-binding protein